ncbi:unnamed protein product [Effrenium voratum]|uniref:Uncharacterized protein n=1 Tax=Effrenium voratum TaxID=2562239 RepID=A0AA36IWH7_9DINO|nr:unnamed protein product [Effrenium voratum]
MLEVNRLLGRLARCVASHPRHSVVVGGPWALVLDAPSLSSSKALVASGFRPEKVVVPNDSDAAAAFPEDAARFARVLKGLSLREFLRRNPPAELPDSLDAESFGFGPFSCVYCDFTQCLYGSWRPSQELEDPSAPLEREATLSSSPLEDLQALVPQLRSPALLGVTLAHLRNSRRQEAQWPKLQQMLATAQRGWSQARVGDRIELKAVATEFWLLGEDGPDFRELQKELEQSWLRS